MATRLSPSAPVIRHRSSRPATPTPLLPTTPVDLATPDRSPGRPDQQRPNPTRRPVSRGHRVLHPKDVTSLDEYRSAGGLLALEQIAGSSPDEITAVVLDSGLRGRGGAGFPTGRKWQTVAANATSGAPSTVVVNGAEGEPGRSRTAASCAAIRIR